MFDQLVHTVQLQLAQGDIAAARGSLDKLWSVVAAKEERTIAHDLGNVIQRAIFEQYASEEV